MFESVKMRGLPRLSYMVAGKIVRLPVQPTGKIIYKVGFFNKAKVYASRAWKWVDGKKLIFGGAAVIIAETCLTGGASLLVQGVGYALATTGAVHGGIKLTKGEGKVSWEIIVMKIIEFIKDIIKYLGKE